MKNSPVKFYEIKYKSITIVILYFILNYNRCTLTNIYLKVIIFIFKVIKTAIIRILYQKQLIFKVINCENSLKKI